MPKTIYVGVDVALETNVVCFVDDSGRRLHTLKSVPNTPAGCERIYQAITVQARQNGFEAVRIGTEATGVLDFHALNDFDSSQEQTDLPMQVYRINPRQVKGFKKAYTQSKTDKIDAFFIADYLRFNQHLTPYHSQRKYLALRGLTRRRKQIVQSITDEKNRLFSSLFLQYPGIVRDKPLSLHSVTACALYAEFTPDQLAIVPADELVQFVIKHSRNNLHQPREKVQAIKKAMRDSYRIDADMARSNAIVIDDILQTIKDHQKRLKQLEAHIAEKMKEFPNVLETIPGIGPVYAGGLIAEIGDIQFFKSDDALAKYAGLTWKKNQSGQSSAEDTPLDSACKSYLRYYMVEAANSLRLHSDKYARFFDKKLNQAFSHKHRRALVLTARKVVRLVYSLLKYNQPYDPGYVSQQPSAPVQ
jgi:transposase